MYLKVVELVLLCQRLVGLTQVIPPFLCLILIDDVSVSIGMILLGEPLVGILYLFCSKAAIVLDLQESVRVKHLR